MNEMDLLREAAAAAPDREPPRIDVAARVMRRIRAAPPEPAAEPWMWAIPAASCAAAAVLVALAARVWFETTWALDAILDPFVWMSL
jgi:hypothetical protein